MKIILNRKDLSKLKPKTREDLLQLLFQKQKISIPKGTKKFYWEGVVDLNAKQVTEYLAGCSEQTISGLQIFAKYGPVIKAKKLNEAGIENYGSFQGSCTKRTRTITGDKEAFLFAWDNWEKAKDGIGRYAVSEKTYTSLAKYFSKID